MLVSWTYLGLWETLAEEFLSRNREMCEGKLTDEILMKSKMESEGRGWVGKLPQEDTPGKSAKSLLESTHVWGRFPDTQ